MVEEPCAVEGDAAVAAQGGELEGTAQGPLQPDGRAPVVLGRSEQGEVEPLRPRGLAPKRMGDRTVEQNGRGKQQQRRKDSGKGVDGRRQQSGGKWSMPWFRVDLGGAELVAGRYTVKAVQSQVSLQGDVGREIWLGVDLLRGGGTAKLKCWMHSGELQETLTGLQC